SRRAGEEGGRREAPLVGALPPATLFAGSLVAAHAGESGRWRPRPYPDPVLTVNAVPLGGTFAEAFPITAARLIVTALTPAWARPGGLAATGFATSVIGCDCEAGVERELSPDETPDGRPGVALLFFAFSRDALQKALVGRVGQCILT